MNLAIKALEERKTALLTELGAVELAIQQLTILEQSKQDGGVG